jgi:hypothetical protein
MYLRLLSAGLVLASAVPAVSATLFQDQLNSAAGWGVNASSADTAATFGYDYSQDGIPEAPNSQAGDDATRGLKMQANIVPPFESESLFAYPVGQSFSGSYQLRFDAWINFEIDGFSGTTEFLGAAIGYDGVSSDIDDGITAMATGDGGSSSDWRVFADADFLDAAEMAAGSRNGSDPYYADYLPGVLPPPVQGQAGGTGAAGSPAFQWITWQFTIVDGGGTPSADVRIFRPGDPVGLLIAEIDCAARSCDGDGNIGLFYNDFFSSVASDPAKAFGLFDNVVVRDVPDMAPVPLPAGLVLMLTGAGALGAVRARRRSG